MREGKVGPKEESRRTLTFTLALALLLPFYVRCCAFADTMGKETRGGKVGPKEESRRTLACRQQPPVLLRLVVAAHPASLADPDSRDENEEAARLQSTTVPFAVCRLPPPLALVLVSALALPLTFALPLALPLLLACHCRFRRHHGQGDERRESRAEGREPKDSGVSPTATGPAPSSRGSPPRLAR